LKSKLDSQWMSLDGKFIDEADVAISGEKWRIHKSDADPFPSNPHAHYMAGYKRFVGCKLHLGTALFYRGRDPLGRRLYQPLFEEMLKYAKQKFPELTFPLPE
jgi:hypothetical protein